MDLGVRLKQLRKSKNMTQVQVSEYLGSERAGYTMYETGKRIPKPETLEKLADLFNVSVDYLLGRETYSTRSDTGFGKRLQSLRNARGLTQEVLSEQLGIARATLAGYEVSGKEPNFDMLIQISDLFNVSIDYLVKGDGTETEVTFGKRLRNLRKEKKLTIREVEAKTGLSNAIISQYENDLREPGMKSIIALSELFDVTTDYLLGREEQK